MSRTGHDARLWGAPALRAAVVDAADSEPASPPPTPPSVAAPWILHTSRYDSSSEEVWDTQVHADHELLWSGAGTVSLEAASTVWMVPPALAIWIPAGTPHRVRAETGAVTYATHLSTERAEHPPAGVVGVVMTPLLRELLLSNMHDEMPHALRLDVQRMVVAMLRPVRSESLDIRMPTSARLRTMAAAIVDDPADDRTTEGWAAILGMSSRTLTRAFQRECGLSFTQWRILVRMRTGLIDIANGLPVSTAAARAGYANPSTFIELFRQTTGYTPAAYFRTISGETAVSEKR